MKNHIRSSTKNYTVSDVVINFEKFKPMNKLVANSNQSDHKISA